MAHTQISAGGDYCLRIYCMSRFLPIVSGLLILTGAQVPAPASAAPAGTITTVAGSGEQVDMDGVFLGGFSGDGGQAADALLLEPGAVAVDAQGEIYIADTFNHRIRKVTPGGIITTVAGSGPFEVGPEGDAFGGSGGDGGPATQARLNLPYDVAVDLQGNLLIADQFNGRVRKVDTGGVISTVAGVGMFPAPAGDGGPATRAVISDPLSVAADTAGDVFVVDCGGASVRKIGPDGIISTVAGNGSVFGSLGDGGPATAASLGHPEGVAVDAQGNLLIADKDHNRIREVMGVAAPGLLAGRPFPAAGPLPGDVNGDRLVTAADATLALRIAMGLLAPSATQRVAADVDGDGQVDVRDAILILREAVGL